MKNQCLICDGGNLEPLGIFYSRFLKKLFHRTAICTYCGHIQVHPMFNEQELKNMNDRFFSGLYLPNNKPRNESDNLRKLKQLQKRLAPIIRKKMNILDVGPGEAWALDYFKKNKCNYFAVESVSKLADSIIARGGVCV